MIFILSCLAYIQTAELLYLKKKNLHNYIGMCDGLHSCKFKVNCQNVREDKETVLLHHVTLTKMQVLQQFFILQITLFRSASSNKVFQDEQRFEDPRECQLGVGGVAEMQVCVLVCSTHVLSDLNLENMKVTSFTGFHRPEDNE